MGIVPRVTLICWDLGSIQFLVLGEVFWTVCGIRYPSDGLEFLPESVRGDLIKRTTSTKA
jgi:hypothetical protein